MSAEKIVGNKVEGYQNAEEDIGEVEKSHGAKETNKSKSESMEPVKPVVQVDFWDFSNKIFLNKTSSIDSINFSKWFDSKRDQEKRCL